MDTSALKVLKISELNALSRAFLEQTFTQIWIEGEISNLIIPASGHVYFSLKDANAQIRAVLFRSQRIKNSITLSNGLHVIVQATVTLYEPRGDYQLLIQQIQPIGLGLLYARFNALKLQLTQEGLFDPNRKKKLPFPQAIGLVTSPSGAVIKDLLSTLKGLPLKIILYPTSVQGNGALTSLLQALQLANQRAEVDWLIIARGGGSFEDLMVFNEEPLARAIAASTLPVISAIGHETDFTITDFVADLRALTPTAAANIVRQRYLALFELGTKIIQSWTNLVEKRLALHKQHLVNLRYRLISPRQKLTQYQQRIERIIYELTRLINQRLKQFREQLSGATTLLTQLNPQQQLKLGFTFITDQGQLIRKIHQLTPQQDYHLHLIDGTAKCKILEIIPSD